MASFGGLTTVPLGDSGVLTTVPMAGFGDLTTVPLGHLGGLTTVPLVASVRYRFDAPFAEAAHLSPRGPCPKYRQLKGL
jgi:hypothetical protein